jgi:hypothetical protein
MHIIMFNTHGHQQAATIKGMYAAATRTRGGLLIPAQYAFALQYAGK